jgi:dipeptidyl aminopeptidase/acylaminoacyl peptidase
MMRFRISPLLALTLLAPALAAQQVSLPLRQSKLDSTAADPRFEVPLDSTAEARWLGGGATAPRWDLAGQWAYFQFSLDPKPIAAGAADDPWWRVSRDGKRVESVAKKDALLVPPNVQYTRDGKRALYFYRGELRYWKQGMTAPRLLIARDGNIGARWSNDEAEIRYADNQGRELYAIDPETGTIRQLTKLFVPPTPRTDRLKDELKREQVELFDFVKRRQADRDTNLARSRRDSVASPFVTPLRANERMFGLDVPTGAKYVSYLVSVPKPDTTPTIFVDYVTESGYAEQRTSRPKVGDPQSQNRLAIVKADPYAIPDSVKITWVDTTGFGKPVNTTQYQWNRQGTRLVAEFISMDWKDRWIALIDPATGKRVKELQHDHDDAWFGGATTGGGSGPTFFQFMPDGETLAVTSEESGWAHLYLVSMDGTKRQLTKGDWELRTIQLSRDGTKWWIASGMEHPNELHLYSMPASGGELKRVDAFGEGEMQGPFPGQPPYTLSPDEKVVATRFTSPRSLSDVYLHGVEAGAKPIRVTQGGTDSFYRIAWSPSDFVKFNDADGNPVYARIYRPKTQHANRPAVFEIHGAGYAQGVHKTFSTPNAHGGALTAQYYTQRGATYLVLDYRGSAGYGRDMRTAIYRDMGNKDIESGIAAIKYVAQNYNVDPKHVGLFGCSYGGFYTLMSLFRHPGAYQAGAAQCSVTDWSHYNHWYTSRILNGSPAQDTAAYRKSSPIYYAAGLQDRLLLQHGLVDNNVEYQDAIRLTQRLMELGKDFELVTYPIDAHGWNTRWAKMDSQRRVAKLFNETIFSGGGTPVQAGTERKP